MPLISTVVGSPADSMTSISSKRRLICTVRIVAATATSARKVRTTGHRLADGIGSRLCDVLSLARGRLRRRGGRRRRTWGCRDVVAMQGVAHDLGKDRSGHGSPEDGGRAVEDHDDGQRRVHCRGKAYEG